MFWVNNLSWAELCFSGSYIAPTVHAGYSARNVNLWAELGG